MRIAPLLLALTFLSTPLLYADDAASTAPGLSSGTASPSDLSESAAPVPISGVADVVDDAVSPTVKALLSLSSTSTASLANIAETVLPDQLTVYYSVDEGLAVDGPEEGAVQINPSDLYAELLQRAQGGDKAARQALDLAILRGDSRAGSNAPNDQSPTASAQNLSPSASPAAVPSPVSPASTSPSATAVLPASIPVPPPAPNPAPSPALSPNPQGNTP